jgi:RNA polymerase sigma factor (sigma-70 family)
VERRAASWLKKHFVTDTFQVDRTAVDDVKQRVAGKILILPGKSDQSGWYDAERFGWKADRLRGWLYRVTRNQAVEHCKLFHNLRKKGAKTITFSDLELNEGNAAESVLKASGKVEFEAFELREIVAECVAELPAGDRDLCRMLLAEGLSQREVAARIGVSAPTVCHRWAKAVRALQAKLAFRGIHATWLGPTA